MNFLRAAKTSLKAMNANLCSNSMKQYFSVRKIGSITQEILRGGHLTRLPKMNFELGWVRNVVQNVGRQKSEISQKWKVTRMLCERLLEWRGIDHPRIFSSYLSAVEVQAWNPLFVNSDMLTIHPSVWRILVDTLPLNDWQDGSFIAVEQQNKGVLAKLKMVTLYFFSHLNLGGIGENVPEW